MATPGVAPRVYSANSESTRRSSGETCTSCAAAPARGIAKEERRVATSAKVVTRIGQRSGCATGGTWVRCRSASSMLIEAARRKNNPDEGAIMTDPGSFTAEHRSWQWELVLQYEDGSLPATAWNESTLGVVASWYAKHLSEEQARARYEQYYHRNHHRLTHRREGAAVATDSI